MRPHPGQAVTCGVKLRMPSDCRILLRDPDFFGAIASRRGRQRNADGVADAFLQQDCHGCAGCHDALGTHAGFGESEMQRIFTARCENANKRQSGPARR